MMSCVFSGIHQTVHQAVALANQLLAGDDLYEAIHAHPGFVKTTASSAQICEAIKICNSRLEVTLYKTKNPFSRVLGYENEWEPTRIYLNARRLDRSVSDIAGTIIHEAVHAADAASSFDFGHDGNRPGGNEGSAPYWIGNWAIWKLEGATGPIVAYAHAASDEGGLLA